MFDPPVSLWLNFTFFQVHDADCNQSKELFRQTAFEKSGSPSHIMQLRLIEAELDEREISAHNGRPICFKKLKTI